MPPKKKNPKEVERAAFYALLPVLYKAVCKQHGIAPNKKIVKEIEDCATNQEVWNKFVMQDTAFTGHDLRAVLDILGRYAEVKNICCWGCNLGDEGLVALSHQLRASGGKFWKGSRIRLLEVTKDGADWPAAKWPERWLAMASGETGMGTIGPGFQMPSMALGHVDLTTAPPELELPEAAAAAAPVAAKGGGPLDAVAALERKLSHLTASSTSITTLQYDALQQASVVHAAQLGQWAPSSPMNTMHQASSTTLPGASATASSPGATAPRMSATATSNADMSPSRAMSTLGLGTTRSGLAGGSDIDPVTVFVTTGGAFDKPLAFSLMALKQLSLALGVKGLSLQVLVLDHNHLGDKGAEVLAEGIRTCSSLKQLSLAYCGIGPAGAQRLGAALVADEAMEKQRIAPPKIAHLNLAGNPVKGQGLVELCPALEACATLKIVNLFGIGVGAGDNLALQRLGEALAANTTIAQVDFDANYIDEAGAALLAPLLASAPHLKKFRHTARLSKAAAQALTAAIREHSPKKKVGKKKKAKK